jgi:ATP-binding cassette subfamily B (MDR/TAP) protein 1
MDELSKAEERILKTQLDSPVTKVSYFSLYRYADKLDIFIAVTSALCSIASGASLPLLSVGRPYFDHQISLFEQTNDSRN